MITYANEITMGESIPELGTGPDATLLEVLKKMASKFTKIEELLQQELFPSGTNSTSLSAKDIPFDDPESGGMGIEAQKLQGSEISVRLERETEAAKLTYDLEQLVAPLQNGQKIMSSVVSISGQKVNGRTQVIPASKQKSMAISVPYNRFPITLDARVTVNTKDGDVELRKTVIVTADDINIATPYDVVDRTSVPAAGNVELAIKRIQAQVRHLETKKA